MVAKSPIATSISSPPGFARSLATIASERSIPATRTPRCESGSAIRPVPIAELERCSVAGELGQEVDGCLDHGRVELLAVGAVVPGGNVLAEVVLGHGGTLAKVALAWCLPTIRNRMIYCVIPRELEDELYDKMVEYYKDNPNVTVIVDRREGDDRRQGREYGGKRLIRDRRRARAPGTFPDTDPPDNA